MLNIEKRPVADILTTYLIGADDDGIVVQSFRVAQRTDDLDLAIRHSLLIWGLAINNADSKFINEFLETISEEVELEIDVQQVAYNILGLFGHCSVDMSSYSQVMSLSVDKNGQSFALELSDDLEEALMYLSRRDYVEVLLH